MCDFLREIGWTVTKSADFPIFGPIYTDSSRFTPSWADLKQKFPILTNLDCAVPFERDRKEGRRKASFLPVLCHSHSPSWVSIAEEERRRTRRKAEKEEGLDAQKKGKVGVEASCQRVLIVWTVWDFSSNVLNVKGLTLRLVLNVFNVCWTVWDFSSN